MYFFRKKNPSSNFLSILIISENKNTGAIDIEEETKEKVCNVQQRTR